MSALSKVIGKFDRNKFRILNTEMSFVQYVDECYKNPKLVRNAWQMIWDMVLSKGIYQVEE